MRRNTQNKIVQIIAGFNALLLPLLIYGLVNRIAGGGATNSATTKTGMRFDLISLLIIAIIGEMALVIIFLRLLRKPEK